MQMFGFDVFPIAAASLDVTADLAPLVSGLLSLLGISAAGIGVSAVSWWLSTTRSTVSLPPVTAAVKHAPQNQAQAV